MMRVAYISGAVTDRVPKTKKPSKNEAFLQEVHEAIAFRKHTDEKRADELFASETEQLEKLKLTLNKLKQTRDEML